MSKRKKSSHKNEHAPKARSGASVQSALSLGVLAGVAIIVGSVFFAYLPSISGGFILDDNFYVTDNKIIKASDGLYRFWCTTEPVDYYPMTNTTLWIEWRLWGMKPTGYHVINLILHIAESLLIWVILRKLSIPGAFLAAIIFAVHPVNVESVAWIAQRKNMLAMLFFLLSILSYLKAETQLQNRLFQPEAGRWYWLSLAAFVLAMLSKGSVAVLPVLLLGIVWWLRPLTKRDLVRTAPFFVVAVALVGVNVWFQTHGSGEEFRKVNFVQRLLGAGGVVWFYLYKALLPIDLSFVYPQWNIQAGNMLWWLPLLVALAVTAVLWRYRKCWSRPLLFAWGFFCAALIPVMGFTDVGFMKYSLVADHYQHIAIIWVIALVSVFWSVWHQRTRGGAHRAATFIAIVAVGALTFLTWQQSRIYCDAITLYQATLGKNSGCWMVHYNLGRTLFDRGRLREAIEHYRQALRLNPDYSEAHNNLGNALLNRDQVQEAIEHYHQALRIKPNYSEAHYNLGAALDQAGRLKEAIEHYRQALLLNPDFPEAHNNLANTLVQAGRPQEAIEHCRQALRLKADYSEAYYNLALAYSVMHQSAASIASAQQALEFARSQGRGAQAKQIEDWLNSYRAGLSELPIALPPTKSPFPPP